MTAPGHRLSTHDRGGAESQESIHPRPEFFCLHVVGIAAKANVAPAQVDRIAVRLAQAAQLRQVAVADPALVEGSGRVPDREDRYGVRSVGSIAGTSTRFTTVLPSSWNDPEKRNAGS